MPVKGLIKAHLLSLYTPHEPHASRCESGMIAGRRGGGRHIIERGAINTHRLDLKISTNESWDQCASDDIIFPLFIVRAVVRKARIGRWCMKFRHLIDRGAKNIYRTDLKISTNESWNQCASDDISFAL